MSIEELQQEMREAESKIAAVIQSLEKNGIRFKELPRPYYLYKCSIKTEVESWS